MPGLLPELDPNGLLEYSVVYTDRAVNHMSQLFQTAMNDISTGLKQAYGAHSVVVVPGSGTFGMEAVARQFATDRKCLVIRNGWFSYRWTQIFAAGSIPSASIVLKARPIADAPQSPFAPCALDEVIRTIETEKPDLVFAPHVETASGMVLPDHYLRAVAAAVHKVGGMFVLDCIASGALWVDMRDCGVDILISAPQKGWSGSPCCGLVLLGELARERIESTTSTSFACDLRKWLEIMEAYEKGGHAYHATLPTDALLSFRDVMAETRALGFEFCRDRQIELGRRVRELLARRELRSVAAPGFEAPGVVVCYAPESGKPIAGQFAAAGLQIAAGVPLQCDEPADYQTFRIGLFGLDKLKDVDAALARLEAALDHIGL